MIEDTFVISNDLLFNLEDVKVLRHFFNFFPTKSINESGLTNTIPADQPILPPPRKPHHGLIKQCLASCNHRNIRQVYVSLALITFVMENARWRHSLLGRHELLDLLIQRILILLHLLLILRLLLLPPGQAVLRLLVVVSVGCATFGEEWIVEVVFADDARVALLRKFTYRNWRCQLLCNDGVPLLCLDQLLILHHFVESLTQF